MSRKKVSISVACIAAFIVITSLAMMIHRKVRSLGEVITELKIAALCAEQLESIGELIEWYQQQSGGANPPSLQVLLSTEEKYRHSAPGKVLDWQPVDPPDEGRFWPLLRCPTQPHGQEEHSYIYRGDDLSSDAPEQMVLVYDKAGNHNTIQNVLFARPSMVFLVKLRSVTEQEYKKACLEYLELYRPQVLITVRQNNEEIAIDTSQIKQAEFHTLCEKIRKDYASGVLPPKSISVSVWGGQNPSWNPTCQARMLRVKSLPPQEFEKAIQHETFTNTPATPSAGG